MDSQASLSEPKTNALDSSPDNDDFDLLGQEPSLPRWRLLVVCFSVCLGLFLALLDSSIVATMLYTIGVEFNALTSVTWVALAYILADVGCATIFNAIGDVVGRKNAYIAAFVIFSAFSIGCGFAQTMAQLVACRVLQGIGGSGLYALSFVILPEIIPPKMRPWIGALAGGVVAMSGVLGPVLGGIITHYSSWRWCFWMNAPITAFALTLFIIAYPKPHQIREVPRRSIRELDIVGCILLIAATVLVTFAFQEAGLVANVWRSALFVAPLVIGCCCWFLLFGWQVVVAKFWEHSIAAIFPLRLMKNRIFIAATGCTLLGGFPLLTIMFSLPLRFQVVNGKSALGAGIGLLPLLGATAIGSFLAGMISAKKDRSFYVLTFASCLMTIACGLLSTLTNTLEVQPKAYGFQVLLGLGFGLCVASVTILGNLMTEIRDTAVSLGIVSQTRLLGGSLGIAASTAILGTNQRRLLTGLVSETQLASLQSSILTMTPTQVHTVQQAYSDAFSETMKVCTAIAGFSILIALCTYNKGGFDVEERQKQQLREEYERQRNMAKTANVKA